MKQGCRMSAVVIACAIVGAACSSSGGRDTATTTSTDLDQISTESVAAEAPEAPEADDQQAEAVEGEQPRYETQTADVLFDQNVVHTFEIELPAAALAELDADPVAEEYVEGSLLFDGERLEAIGVRYKGSTVGCEDVHEAIVEVEDKLEWS
jgi:hypothetical protein